MKGGGGQKMSVFVHVQGIKIVDAGGGGVKNWQHSVHVVYRDLVYDRNHYFGLGSIQKPKPKLADTFGRYSKRYWNHILKGESSY